MLQDVERILDYWDAHDILRGNPNRTKIAWMVESQRQTTKLMVEAAKKKNQNYPISQDITHTLMGAIMYIGEHHPNVFSNTIDFQQYADVYRLGPWPRGDWDDRRKKITMRVVALYRSLGKTLVFGGFVLKDGRLYLLAGN